MYDEQFTTKVDGKVISSLMLYYIELPSRNLAVIEEVWTHPDHRRQGHSTVLIRKAIDKAKELGADCVELTVRQDAPHIQQFYESFGFEDRKNVAMRLKLRDMKPWNHESD